MSDQTSPEPESSPATPTGVTPGAPDPTLASEPTKEDLKHGLVAEDVSTEDVQGEVSQ